MKLVARADEGSKGLAKSLDQKVVISLSRERERRGRVTSLPLLIVDGDG
jgi:hypothetical protein